MIRNLIQHPLTKNLDIDDPQTTDQRKKIIQDKIFLNKIYREWYKHIVKVLPDSSGKILELGSGAGFIREYLPGIILSDIIPCKGISVVLDGTRIPFSNDSLDGIVMTDVLHHIPHPRSFFSEASRCVKNSGRIVMIEPWMTFFSTMVYNYLHPEPMSKTTTEWEFPITGPLSGANIALPWIIFKRDRKHFEREFPQWKILSIELIMPFRFLLSGGFTVISLQPGFLYEFWKFFENIFKCLYPLSAMFAVIVLEKTNRSE